MILLSHKVAYTTNKEERNMIRTRVYEKQWGGSTMDYIQHFDNMTEIKKFRLQTGFKVVVEK